MKKITFTILVLSLFSIGFVKAQALDTIPNGDFEHWNGTGKAKQQPQGWDTLSGVAFPTPDVAYETNSLSPSPSIIDRPVYDGKTALSLTCTTRGTLIYIGEVECKFKVKNQDPFINMNMAYMEGAAPQSPIFDVILWNSQTHDTVCNTGILFLNGWNTVASDVPEPWTTLNIPLNYSYRNNGLLPASSDTTTPDSCHIILLNAIPANGIGNPSASALYIEKIWFANAAAAGVSPVLSSAGNVVSVYPNPFSNKTIIHYNLTQSGEVNLTVFDLQGKEVTTLVNGNQAAGTYNQVFDATGLNDGVYIYKLQTSTGVQTGKLILNR